MPGTTEGAVELLNLIEGISDHLIRQIFEFGCSRTTPFPNTTRGGAEITSDFQSSLTWAGLIWSPVR